MRNRWFRVWALLLTLFFSSQDILAARELNTCEKGSCLPGTGNLLIGRENRLWASSTCGLRNQEKFCIVTSLEDQKKCFWCDSRPTSKDYRFTHKIENVVSKTFPSTKKQSWWQSQNGVENVTIQLDLEAEFYFTYLYMRFKTFRPAALLVERSYDYGQTWKVYRYFASDCGKFFKYVPDTPQNNLTVPYCDMHYSSVTPFTNGEVILRILPSTLDDIDPYSDDIQNLVKITNLRINFTKLHTLGDDLLDNRVDIQEKYYYAIWEMVVGGSCSCYGHANRCVPQDGVESKPNMVHGKCECTHNTKGLNCEKCEDLYNDLEWAPAIGKQTNACKKCNCNEHATSCHFDHKIFESTGRVSGGMCDNCMHNTMGKNCEQCKHFFYQDPTKEFNDPEICIPCDCDPAGSLDDGICDSRTDPANNLESGRCHCKRNVEGRRCDTCKNGFWNFTENNPEGCQSCSCNIHGIISHDGCNKNNGECWCKRNVEGRDCNRCIREHWGLGDTPDGCQPCDCDKGGSLHNECDMFTGQCPCRNNITGRRCDMPKEQHFIPSLDYNIIEAELIKCAGSSCTLDIRPQNPPGQDTTWTGPGFARVYPPSTLEFPVDNVRENLDYNIIVRYEPTSPYNWDRARVILIRPEDVDQNGYCGGDKLRQGDTRDVYLLATELYAKVDPPFCLEKGKNYTVRVDVFRTGDPNANGPTAYIQIDSIVLVPHIESIPFMNKADPAGERRLYEYKANRCDDYVYPVVKTNMSDICRGYHYSIGSYVYGSGYPCKCDSTGSQSSICSDIGGYCPCKSNVVGRQCDKCAPGTYGFGPEGCKACDCNSIGSLDNFCDVYSGQCKCRQQTYGRSCDQCQPGSWNYPNCQKCICHGHADICEPRSGACIECRNSTEGHYCDKCKEGFYGDPRIGIDIPCRLCPCPGTVETGHTYAQRCALDSRNQDVICDCDTGYTGSKCERCAENYYGNPDIVGGKCQACNCSNNVDTLRPGNCDPNTGKCLQCLYNTEGFNCEFCRAGFFGDALHQQCAECVCDLLGTDRKQGPCDKFTGQCPCLPNVTGLRCDECIKNHWKIASGEGCEACACDPIGSKSEQCNQYDGQCECKDGFGGRRCDQCQANFWGNPNVECYPCNCNPEGAATMQCNRTNGHCVCVLGIGGDKCDRCARGFLGESPRCSPCGECFDNWDLILKDLKDQTKKVIDKAVEIMKTGATGSYVKEFETMEKKLADVKLLLQNTTASHLQLQELDTLINDIRAGITPPELMNNVSSQAENITQRITISLLALADLQKKADNLNVTTQGLKENATKLQEGNVEGALNLTKQAYNKTLAVKQKNAQTEVTVSNADKSCQRTDGVIRKHNLQYSGILDDDEKKLVELTKNVNDLESLIPDLNLKVCDKGGNPCDNVCGGAGCGSCGGLSCENGSLTKAENTVKFSQDAAKLVQEKEAKVNELYRSINQARAEAKNAYSSTQDALKSAEMAKNESEIARNKTQMVIKELQKFVNSSGTTLANVRTTAEETMNKTIKLQPEKITELAQKINETVSSLTNIEAIIKETEQDLIRARLHKQQAELAKNKADTILNTTEKVVTVLSQAEESQKKAEAAIASATENIDTARKDLTEISNQSAKAQQTINETVEEFLKLEESFKTLQTEFLKNNADAMTVEDELKAVIADVDDTQKKSQNLTADYKQIAAELEKKAMNSTDAHKNAQLLLNRASQLSLNTTNKIKELTDFEEQFKNHDKELDSITNKIKELTKKMQTNFDEIKAKSENYQVCQ
ncbi:laminin subunit beta-1 [Planococcus citri]|uniref:laminin subunit beta-1 n=1 Tax=Planococcus citri TaxID=170843 RepID=UPI0031F7774E